MIQTDVGRAKVIKLLLDKGYSDDIWTELTQTNPNLATRLSYARIQSERRSDLQMFETNQRLRQGESWWQDFFERSKWIFGYGLNYKILKSVQIQPNYGGTNLTGRGAQRGDFLLFATNRSVH